MPKNPKTPENPFLPGLRRSTFRAPDPQAARGFDLTLPDAPHASEPPAPDGDAARIGHASDGGTADAATTVEPLTGTSGTPAATPHPRHRADRIGNRRPSSGLRRTLMLG